jgi:hypothetical protein
MQASSLRSRRRVKQCHSERSGFVRVFCEQNREVEESHTRWQLRKLGEEFPMLLIQLNPLRETITNY